MKETKRELRLKIKKSLASLDKDRLRDKSAPLSRFLNHSMQRGRHLTWGVFFPTDKEPKWQMEIDDLESFKLAWPKFKALGEMEFYQCRELDLIPSREFGPEIPCPPPLSKTVPEALVVPALGLTRSGKRLGRGKGYYDRILKTFRGPTIGLCFEEQLCDEIPEEEHDQRVQIVITDKQVLENETVIY
ncbi:MAG: 5-formyltetrahydrofolate cyclo-ligase [Bacteriovoracales bacterium]|nr:5-formyltetrahydrofolate cyclo-ligase [Bacteriovoracales bacterium]